MGSNEHNYVHWGTINVASFLTDRWALFLSLPVDNFTRRRAAGRRAAGARGGCGSWERADLMPIARATWAFHTWPWPPSSGVPSLALLAGSPPSLPPPLAAVPGGCWGSPGCHAGKPPSLANELAEPLGLLVPRENCAAGLRRTGGERRPKPRNGTLARTQQCALACVIAAVRKLAEKDAAISRKRDSSAHLLSLYPGLTQSGTHVRMFVQQNQDGLPVADQISEDTGWRSVLWFSNFKISWRKKKSPPLTQKIH